MQAWRSTTCPAAAMRSSSTAQRRRGPPSVVPCGVPLLGAVEAVIIGGAVWPGRPRPAGGGVHLRRCLLPDRRRDAAGARRGGHAGDRGLTKTLIVLAVVIVVQQLDGDLSPRRSTAARSSSTPVVLVALSAGGVPGGIVGAFLAVPRRRRRRDRRRALARRAELPDDRPGRVGPGRGRRRRALLTCLRCGAGSGGAAPDAEGVVGFDRRQLPVGIPRRSPDGPPAVVERVGEARRGGRRKR